MSPMRLMNSAVLLFIGDVADHQSEADGCADEQETLHR